MWGVHSRHNFAQSVRSTNRNTPCVLRCCGPMFTNISPSGAYVEFNGLGIVKMRSHENRCR